MTEEKAEKQTEDGLSQEEIENMRLGDLVDYVESAILVYKEKANGEVRIFSSGYLHDLLGHMFLGAFNIAERFHRKGKREEDLKELLDIIKDPTTKVSLIELDKDGDMQ